MRDYDYEIWLDDVSNKDVGITLQGAVEISAATPRIETVEIPGRNGDLHFWDGSFENRTASVDAFVYSPDFVKHRFGEVNQWLLGNFGYRKLVTNDDREHFLMARVGNGADIVARMNKLAPFTINFDCRPERFLTIGEERIEVYNKGTIVRNPTAFTSKPLYKIYTRSSSTASVSVGANTLTFQPMTIDFVFYDAETRSMFDSDGDNLNMYASGDLPFECGEQAVTFNDSVSTVEIIPRWWEL